MKNKNTASAPFPLWATVFTVLGMILVCGLGIWQLERLTWKNAMIAALDQAYAAKPMDTKLTYDSLMAANRAGKQFKRGHVAGQYLYQNEIAIGPRPYKGLAGYHIVTPMALEDGGIILVNRGWVPTTRKEAKDRAEGQLAGRVIVTGLARPPMGRGAFMPANNPDENEWFYTDTDDVAVHFGLRQVVPFVLMAERPDHKFYSYPLPDDAKWAPRNNHLGYALFWFSMAGALGVVYYLRFFGGKKK